MTINEDMKKVFELLKSNPAIGTTEGAASLSMSLSRFSSLKTRLKQRGFIDYVNGKPVIVLREYADISSLGYKAECVYLMVDRLMSDVMDLESFSDRLQAVQEIRLLLKML